MTEANAKRVMVGLSGGVDSSVSALLLKNAGYRVIGVFIKVWQPDFLPCDWREERRMAMRAAACIGIPFTTLDLEQVYKQGVVDYMLREYAKGRVPNPDMLCNKEVKFGAFLDYALANGAEMIATGHYARTTDIQGERRLKMAVDQEKDQSYFLSTLGARELSRTLFPIGELTKREVREIARNADLPNADKKDSQGLCFMGKVDMETFLSHYIDAKEGDVLSEDGEVIGRHRGAMLYAIGQRHGFSTNKTSPAEPPLFVIGKDLKRNTITVAHVPRESDRRRTRFAFDRLFGNPRELAEEGIAVRLRHRGELIDASVAAEGSGGVVNLRSPADISVGQFAVFYRGEICLGGATIERTG